MVKQRWIVAIGESLLGPVFKGARQEGRKWTMDPPPHVREFLNLVPAHGATNTLLLGDFAQIDTDKPGRKLLKSVAAERRESWSVVRTAGNESCGVTLTKSRRASVTLRCEIERPPRPRPAGPGWLVLWDNGNACDTLCGGPWHSREAAMESGEDWLIEMRGADPKGRDCYSFDVYEVDADGKRVDL